MPLGFFSYIKDFWNLFFPEVCNACGEPLVSQEEIVCSKCLYHLPVRKDVPAEQDALVQLYWGRILVQNSHALFHFSKHSGIQNLLHRLKYHHRPEIGVFLGRWQGQRLQSRPEWKSIDYIVPVPLHPSREALRGYNQSERYAQGLSEVLQIPVMPHALVRHKATSSQTRKSRLERFDNMQEVFSLHPSHSLDGKHVLLVDDVITTGATLESCANTLLQTPQLRLSIASIAFAGGVH